MLSLMLMACFVWAQNYTPAELQKMKMEQGAKGARDISPVISKAGVATEKATWDIMYNWTTNAAGQQGIGYDGTNFFTAKWNDAGKFVKYTNAGAVVDSFVIATVGGIRDLAYDGQFFYGGASTAVIYQMNFANQSLVSSITATGKTIRHCTFDPSADNGNGGFWIGNWTDLFLVSRTGAVLATSTATLESIYGSAYDDVTEGGPYLWLFAQEGTDNRVHIKQFNISTLALTGVEKIANDIPGYDAVNGIAGGLETYKDLNTGKLVLVGNIQQDPNLIFGYELGVIASPNAPGMPTAFAVAPGAAGALNASISWTNPSVTVGGAALTELTSVKLYRGETLIHTVATPAIGGNETFVDNTITASGVYTYTVKGENAAGVGLSASVNKYIGVDMPGAPTSVVLAANGEDGTITWVAPTVGLNGGYFDASTLSYTIVRNPGAVAIANGITALTYTDATVPNIGNYSYTVTAVNAAGNGGAATSNTVLLGAEGLVGVTIGNDVTTVYNIPFNFFYKNSIAQSMYFAEEIGIGGGAITAIVYKNNFLTDLSAGKPVKIWMAQTAATNLTSDWMAYDQFTLVYDGNISLPAGENEIVIPLTTPFVYTGGNIVVMTNRPMDTGYFSSSDKFFYSTTAAHADRTKRAQSDDTTFDPANLSGVTGTLSNTLPNIQFYVSTEGLASLSGVVTDGTNPIEGATVTIEGNPSVKVTDATGAYSFPYLIAGTYNVTVEKLGFASSTQQIVLAAEQVGVLNFSLTALPVVTVSGKVVGSDNTAVGLAGAEISLEGYQNYTATTDANGDFTIAGVYTNNTYEMSIVKAGYANYSNNVVVADVNLALGNITINELALPAVSVVAEEAGNNANVSWRTPGSAVTSEFRYDSGVNDGQLGFSEGTATSVMGSTFARNAQVQEISWYTTAEGGPHTAVNVFVLALDAAGTPTSTVLYSAMNVPNTDLQWNTHVLSTPADAPNGFMLALSYVGFLGLGTDVPDATYPFMANTHFYAGDYTTGEFTAVDAVAQKNFMLRAIGLDNGAAKATGIAKARKGYIGETPVFVASEKVNVGEPTYTLMASSSKSLVGYNVYRLIEGQEGDEALWVSLATAQVDTTYVDASWNTLTPAIYKYAVKAVYTNSVLSVPAFSNALPKAMTAPVTINVTTNGGDAATGASVVLTNQDGNSAHVYTATAPANGVVTFAEVWKGTYDLAVTLSGYEEYAQEDVTVSDATEIDVELTEIIVAPFNPAHVQTGPGEVEFSWNNAGNDFFEDFEGFADFSQDFTPWATVTTNTSATYGFNGITFPGTEEPFAYIVFNPTATTPIVDGMTAFSGERFAASFANTTPPNASWLITPQVGIGNNTVLTFMVKTFTDQYGLERYNVLVSTTDTQLSSFTKISTGTYLEAPADAWTEVTFDLSSYSGENVYVAIQCVSNDAFVFMVDDVYIGAPQTKSFTNYKVYLDGTEVATTTDLNYTFTGLSIGNHTAGVQAVYSSGSSEVVNYEFEVVEIAPTYTVTFVVNDQNGAAVSDAVVTFDGTAMAAGQYVVADVEAGTYNYSVARTGYSTVTGSVTVENQDITETVVITGAADYKVQNLQVYPVPANNQVTVKAGENIEAITVIDVTGRIVYQNAQVAASELEISVNGMNEGIYFVQIQTANGTAVRRIQVVK